MGNKIYIHAQDCLPITCNEEESMALFHFLKEVEPTIHHFSNKQKEQESIIYFDYKIRKWCANRYIGECEFAYNNRIYVLKITPRFGNETLLKLFEYIYATKLPPSFHHITKTDGLEIHKILVSLMWVSMLKKAHKHGLIRENRKVNEQGTSIRGKFLVKDSLIDVQTKNKLHYQYSLKDINNTANQILYKAYQILKKDYCLSNAFISPVIRTDLEKLAQYSAARNNIHFRDYKKIRYSTLFAGYKQVVDLSWNIISSQQMNIDTHDKLGKSFFLDMAEVWEFFVHRLLVKNLKPYGWNLVDNESEIYASTFYNRKIIPDIVLKNNHKILIADAKYKRMNFNRLDVDQTDLFQIHTYSYYYDDHTNEVYASLVYPLEKEINYNKSGSTIFSKPGHPNYFLVDGVDVSDPSDFENNIIKFINSILQKTNTL